MEITSNHLEADQRMIVTTWRDQEQEEEQEQEDGEACIECGEGGLRRKEKGKQSNWRKGNQRKRKLKKKRNDESFVGKFDEHRKQIWEKETITY